MPNLKSKVTPEQFQEIKQEYSTIKKYLIGAIATGIATALTVTGIMLSTYISTNQRIDQTYQENKRILDELRENRYKIGRLEEVIYTNKWCVFRYYFYFRTNQN